MVQSTLRRRYARRTPVSAWAAGAAVLSLAGAMTITGLASAATSPDLVAPVSLGTVGSYSVLGGSTVTNTGPSRLDRDLGVSPGTAITGFPPGETAGETHQGDAAAAQAQSDLVVAYDDAAGRAPTALIAGDLVGQTLTSGVYKSSGPIAVSGTLTLDGQGDPDSVFIFQGGIHLDHRIGQQRRRHQRRPGVPRLLAGRQLRDAGHHVDLHRDDHGADRDHGHD